MLCLCTNIFISYYEKYVGNIVDGYKLTLTLADHLELKKSLITFYNSISATITLQRLAGSFYSIYTGSHVSTPAIVLLFFQFTQKCANLPSLMLSVFL